MTEFGRKVRFLFRRRRFERELDEEMRVHLEMKSGQAARKQFGNVTLLKEVSREMWGWSALEKVLQDVRYGVRMLVRSPGFTAVAVLALAMGIGANTAIFSVVNAVLLRPLPYRDADRVVAVSRYHLQRQQSSTVPPADYADWRDQGRVFEDLAYSWDEQYTLTGAGAPDSLFGYAFSSNFFAMLGAKPLLGRTFLPEEGQPGKERVVVLSFRLWQNRFGADAQILGKAITLNGNDYTVIGVMPAEFGHPSQSTELWTPLSLRPGDFENRRFRYFRVVGRLKAGVTLEQAQQEMSALAGRLAALHPDTNTGWGVRLQPIRETYLGGIKPTLLALQGAVVFLLPIACANVANLLLARAAARAREVAVRTALGAGRLRLFRQFLTEGLVLSLFGGAAGLALAFWSTDALPALFPANIANTGIPGQGKIPIDVKVLMFNLVVSMLAGVTFAAAPAWRAASDSAGESLKEGGRSLAGAAMKSRVRNALLVGEVALSLVLLIGAGLMVKSFVLLLNRDLGLRPDHTLTMSLSLPPNKYTGVQSTAAFVERVLEQMKAVPGVEYAGAVNNLPLSGSDARRTLSVEGQPEPDPAHGFNTHFRVVTPDYFRAMGIPLRRGRSFTDRDRLGAPNVAIINETVARAYWPNENPVGKRIRVADLGTPAWHEVVGVVGDVKHHGAASETLPEVYRPFYQAYWPFLWFAVRTSGDPMRLAPALRNAVWAVDKDQPVKAVLPLEQLAAESLAVRRVSMVLLAVFSGVALLLACLGIYGVISYAVGRRTHEIGVRMALGARPADVLKMVVGQGAALVGLGVAVGVAGAIGLTGVLSRLLFGVTPTDPVTFACAASLLAIVGVTACYFPARRAARVDPMVALRHE